MEIREKAALSAEAEVYASPVLAMVTGGGPSAHDDEASGPRKVRPRLQRALPLIALLVLYLVVMLAAPYVSRLLEQTQHAEQTTCEIADGPC